MRTNEPRVLPVADDELSEEQAEALSRYRGPSGVFNIFRTMVRAPKALRRFGPWGGYVLSDDNSLPARERELVILRTGYRCGSGYEWAQHAVIGAVCGLTASEIEWIKAGPEHREWSTPDRLLLRAVDELVSDHHLSDQTWQALSDDGGFTERQKMDLVFTTGQYTQVSMMLNSFGVQLDGGLEADPDLTPASLADTEAVLEPNGGRLQGKSVLVSGAGQAPGPTIGNGRAIAELFAAEGALVACADRQLERAEATAAAIIEQGGTAIALEADVTDEAGCQAAVADTVAAFGRLDVLINNVGIGSAADGPAAQVEAKALDLIIEVNLKGALRMVQAALPVMREQGGAAIVNVSSLASTKGGGQLAYEVSKAGLNRLTTSVAASEAGRRIRCNAVLPGLLDTPMAVDAIASFTGQDRAEVKAQRDALVPLGGQMGTASDTAYAALYLASDEASFVTGALLAVDGGLGL